MRIWFLMDNAESEGLLYGRRFLAAVLQRCIRGWNFAKSEADFLKISSI